MRTSGNLPPTCVTALRTLTWHCSHSHRRLHHEQQPCRSSELHWYEVALVSRIDKIIGLFCKRALLKRLHSAKETYNFIDPTDRSHPIVQMLLSVCLARPLSPSVSVSLEVLLVAVLARQKTREQQAHKCRDSSSRPRARYCIIAPVPASTMCGGGLVKRGLSCRVRRLKLRRLASKLGTRCAHHTY